MIRVPGVADLPNLRVLSPLSSDSLIAFTPFVALYGVVLYRIWCRRFVAGWRGHPIMATA